MRVETVFPGDELWSAWYASYRDSLLHEGPDSSPYAEGEMRVLLTQPTSGDEMVAFAGIVDGAILATMTASVYFKDNADMVFAHLAVHPDAPRDGRGSDVGDRMLEHLESFARERGRSLVTIEAHYPADSPEDGSGTEQVELLRSHGYRYCLGRIIRRLRLPVDVGLLQGLREESEPHHAGYSFRQYLGPAPEDLVEEVGRLMGSLNIEAPLGDLELEAEVYDVERLREEERNLEAMRRRRYATVALDVTGRPVAYTELVVAPLDGGKVYQWGTIVAPEHRGHRLGMAVKVRNLEYLQAREPDVTSIETDNAGSNEHMVAINDRLGFLPVERAGEFQKRL